MGFYKTTILFSAIFYSICGVFTMGIIGEDLVGRLILSSIFMVFYVLSFKFPFIERNLDKICALLFPLFLMHYSYICLSINDLNPSQNVIYLVGYLVISGGVFQSFDSGKLQIFVGASFLAISYFVWTKIPLMNIGFFYMNYVILLTCSFVLSLKLRSSNNKVKESIECIDKVKRETITKSIVNSLSHEINNPLTIIMGTATILKIKHKDQIDIKHIENLENSINRIRRVMNVVKTCTPNENQTEEIINIVDEVENYMQLFQEKMKQLKINYKMNILSKDIFCSVKKSDLYFIIGNLVDNAVFFSCKKERHRYIEISLYKDDDFAYFEIENSCIIDKKIITKVFEPFVTTKEIHEGSGLGLFGVKNLLKQYNGEIFLKSKENDDANFVFKLPLKDV